MGKDKQNTEDTDLEMAKIKYVKPSKSQEKKAAAPAVPDPEPDPEPEPDNIPELENDNDDDESIAVEQREDEEAPGGRDNAEDSYHEPEETDDELTQRPSRAGVTKKPQKKVPAKTVVVIDEGEDGEESEAADDNDPDNPANPPAASTVNQQKRQAVATIRTNWNIAHIRDMFTADNWLTNGLRNIDDNDWELATLLLFQRLSNMTVGQTEEMRKQFHLHWRVRKSTGQDRAVGSGRAGKQVNLRDDLTRLCNGDREPMKANARATPRARRPRTNAQRPSKGDGGATGRETRSKTQANAANAKEARGGAGPTGQKTAKRKPPTMLEENDDSSDTPDEDATNRRPTKKPKKNGNQPTKQRGTIAKPKPGGASIANRNSRVEDSSEQEDPIEDLIAQAREDGADAEDDLQPPATEAELRRALNTLDIRDADVLVLQYRRRMAYLRSIGADTREDKEQLRVAIGMRDRVVAAGDVDRVRERVRERRERGEVAGEFVGEPVEERHLIEEVDEGAGAEQVGGEGQGQQGDDVEGGGVAKDRRNNGDEIGEGRRNGDGEHREEAPVE